VSTDEISVGPLYFATEESVQKWFWPHKAQIAEMCEPYRTGTAIILPTGTLHLLAVGIWTRDIYDDVIEFPNRWPDWMQSYEPDEDDGEIPSWVKGGGRFKPRPYTEEELNALEKEEDTRGVEES
jgi:hypothetical protein